MDEDKFWEYISLIDSYPRKIYNKYEKEDTQSRLIKMKILKSNSFKELVDYDRIYNEKLNDLFQPKIVELQMVNYLLIEELIKKRPYVSNDGFRDFRGYIIGLGRKNYELVKNFKKEDEIFHIDFYVNVAYRSDLEFIYSELYDNHFSKLDKDEIEKMDKEHTHPNYFLSFEDMIDQIDWNKLDKKYPKMIAKTKEENNSDK